jgi:hypothetical protein
MFGAFFYPLFPGIFCFSAVAYSAKKIKNWELGPKKVDLDCFNVHLFGLKRFF